MRRLVAAALILFWTAWLTSYTVADGAIRPNAAQAGIACPQVVVCTYEHKGYGGQMYYYSGPFNKCILIGGWWKYNISSVINHKDIPVRLYHNATCSSNLWNVNVRANDSLWLTPEQLNDHVWSIWIGFTPPG